MIRRVEASGLEAVRLATDLLHRVRLAHSTVGLWEAADVQWWWRTPRRSDEVAKPFWLDDDGPVASALLTGREACGLETEPAKALYTGLGFEVVTTDRGWVLELA